MTSPRLATNNLLMPSDFPTESFERAYSRAKPAATDHFNAAWNAISLRFLTMCAEGEAFRTAITAADAGTSFEQRYNQERHLFGFFSNGLSAFESFFYGMFSVGAVLFPTQFPMATPRDQQAISPTLTVTKYRAQFARDPIVAAMQSVSSDNAYLEWKMIRNILSHRTAPGRTVFASTGDDAPAPRWKIADITLDGTTLVSRREHAARLLTILLDGAAIFVETRL
jgi:hypothetical protein